MGGGSCLAMNALSEDFERHAHTCQSFSFHYALTCTDGEDGDIYIYIYLYILCVYILSPLVVATRKSTGQNAKYYGCLSWVPPKARKKKREKEPKNARKKTR